MHILKYILITVSGLIATIAYSQSLQSNDSNIVLLSEANIYYTPNNELSNINLSFVRFTNKTEGIRFIFTTKRTANQLSIKTDSILLQSGNKILTLSKLYSDTIYWKENGNLCLSFTHFLSREGINFLKEMPVTNIIFIANGKPMQLNTVAKSRRNIKAIANDIY